MIFADFETTGLLKPNAVDVQLQPYITEACLIKLDENFNHVDEIDTLVRPPVPIPDEVIKITGITNEMVIDAPTFVELYDDLCDLFLGEKVIIAHNAPFDTGVLKWELTRHDFEFKFPWPKYYHCTVEISKPINNKAMNLTKLHEWATGRMQIEGAHRAKNDVYALIRSYAKLVEEGYVEIVV